MIEDIFSWHALCGIQLCMEDNKKEAFPIPFHPISITGGYDDAQHSCECGEKMPCEDGVEDVYMGSASGKARLVIDHPDEMQPTWASRKMKFL